MQNLDITICSVYHSLEAKRLLELNYDLVQKMNPNIQIQWIVADNTPKGFTDKINENKFTIVPGADGFQPVPDWLIGSYHHSEAINNSLKHITTRFAVFLDIDFYILRKNWMRIVLAHMQKNDLALFGAPWHPVHIKKIRYFPGPHALFVDLKKVPISQIDFFINNIYLGSSKSAPFNLSFTPDDIQNILGTNILKVIVYDTVLNKTESETTLTLAI